MSPVLSRICGVLYGIFYEIFDMFTLAIKMLCYTDFRIANYEKLRTIFIRNILMVMNLMQTAETKFETGAERKEWVLAMVKASADTIDYDIDMDAISDLIDSLCNMSKVVNAPKA